MPLTLLLALFIAASPLLGVVPLLNCLGLSSRLGVLLLLR
jgi:hypothetical protein